MPDFRSGKKAHLKLVHAGTTFIASSFLDTSELDRLCETYDVTTYGTGGHHAFIAGLRSAAIKGAGPWASTADAFIDAALGSTAAVTFAYSPGSTANGQRLFNGSMILKNCSIQAPAAGRNSWTLDADVTGPITSTFHS